MNETTTIAVIPARGGSKGIPRKNIAMVAQKPLIAWTIQAAQSSQYLSQIIVSTEDEEIARVAQQWGAKVPFLRPPELSRDDTPSIDPILHAVSWLEKQENCSPTYIMLLQPTSPLRTAYDIDTAIEIAYQQQVDSVVSVTPSHHHPYWCKRVTETGKLTDFLNLEKAYTRRQDLPPAYALNGAIYLVRREVLLQKKTFYTDNTYAYSMPEERSLDIDTPWDLYIVNLILQDRTVV